MGYNEDIAMYLSTAVNPPPHEPCACGGPVMTNERDFSG